MDKVNFNQKCIGGKLEGERWVVWERLLQKVGGGCYFYSHLLLITTAEKRK